MKSPNLLGKRFKAICRAGMLPKAIKTLACAWGYITTLTV